MLLADKKRRLFQMVLLCHQLTGKLLRLPKAFRMLIFVVSLLTLTTILYMLNIDERVNRKRCFQATHQVWDVQLLQDILEADKQPQMGKSVFFHETSCTNGVVKLNARQACAIESAAKTTPSWDVFLLFASPSGFSNSTPKSPVIAALETYPNIYMRNVNLWSYAAHTPINKWIYDEDLFYSSYINSHTSDFLRYLR